MCNLACFDLILLVGQKREVFVLLETHNNSSVAYLKLKEVRPCTKFDYDLRSNITDSFVYFQNALPYHLKEI
jgi:hypothetical protein